MFSRIRVTLPAFLILELIEIHTLLATLTYSNQLYEENLDLLRLLAAPRNKIRTSDGYKPTYYKKLVDGAYDCFYNCTAWVVTRSFAPLGVWAAWKSVACRPLWRLWRCYKLQYGTSILRRETLKTLKTPTVCGQKHFENDTITMWYSMWFSLLDNHSWNINLIFYYQVSRIIYDVLAYLCDFPARVISFHQTQIQTDRWLLRFQMSPSENAVFKYLRRSAHGI